MGLLNGVGKGKLECLHLRALVEYWFYVDLYSGELVLFIIRDWSISLANDWNVHVLLSGVQWNCVSISHHCVNNWHHSVSITVITVCQYVIVSLLTQSTIPVSVSGWGGMFDTGWQACRIFIPILPDWREMDQIINKFKPLSNTFCLARWAIIYIYNGLKTHIKSHTFVLFVANLDHIWYNFATPGSSVVTWNQ